MISLVRNLENLGRVFPAFLRVAWDGTILARGPAIQRHAPAAGVGAVLASVFDDVPDLAQCARNGTAMQLHAVNPALHLYGTVLEEEGGFLLALNVVPMAPWPTAGPVSIADFAPSDPAVPAIMLAGVQAALIEESKEIALELAAERQRMIDLLERVTAAAASTAHELNNVISIIGLNCDRLERETADQSQAARLVGIIRETAMRGAALTRAMMELAERPEQPERLGMVAPERCQVPARVLVVEDEIHALEALAELLDGLGYEVTACANGEVALAALGRQRFDVLLTDVVMPGISGLELAEMARRADPDLAVVLMSGYLPDGGEQRDEWLFLHKPLDLGRLDAILGQFGRSGRG